MNGAEPRSPWKTLTAIASIVGGLLLLAWGVLAIRAAIASRSWQATGGRITVSEIREWRDREGPDDRPVLRFRDYRLEYRFVVDGFEYASGEISVEDAGGAAMEMAGLSQPLHEMGYYRRLESRFPVGREVTVYYDPENPRRCALEEGLSLGSVVPFLCGVGLLGVAFLGLARRPTAEIQPPRPRWR